MATAHKLLCVAVPVPSAAGVCLYTHTPTRKLVSSNTGFHPFLYCHGILVPDWAPGLLLLPCTCGMLYRRHTLSSASKEATTAVYGVQSRERASPSERVGMKSVYDEESFSWRSLHARTREKERNRGTKEELCTAV